MRLKSIITLTFLIFGAAICCASTEMEYLAIFIDGQKVGHASRIREQTENEVRTTEKVNLTITRFNMPMTVYTSETYIESPKGEPLGFESIQDMSLMKMRISGKVNPDGTVDITTDTGSLQQKKQMKWPQGAVMAEGLLLMQKEKGLKPGTEYKAKVFSPAMLNALETKITVGEKKKIDLLGRAVNLAEVISKTSVLMAGEIVSTSYVDDDFNALKTLTPMLGMQLEMISCPKEFALSENSQIDIFSKAFIKSPEPIKNINSVKRIRYYLKPAKEGAEFTIPSNDNQTVEVQPDGGVIVTVTPIKNIKTAQFGYYGTDQDVRDSLKPSRFVQSDDPNIAAEAKKIVKKIKNAAHAAKEIERFVAVHIENKSLSIGYATASEVFQSREGDCTEFAVLTAAMCRAVGIPARVVVGVAYVDEFMELEDVFGGHAWTEVYLNGKWVGLDSAFRASGRGGFDAGHIALAMGSGDLEDFFGVLFNLGQFKIEKIEIEK
jgi:transglutaminase/protease-like cytokinesis protein 3